VNADFQEIGIHFHKIISISFQSLLHLFLSTNKFAKANLIEKDAERKKAAQ